MKDKMIKVGKYNSLINDALGVEYVERDIYRSSGLISHLYKRHHYNALKHIDDIPNMIAHPDYVGINPNEDKNLMSFECVKDGILVGVKFDQENDRYFVSTIHEISNRRLERDIRNRRLKVFVDIRQNMEYNENAKNINSDEPE